MKIFISAGEQSGDIHAAKLMKSLREKLSNVEFVGFGGEKMSQQGLKPLADINEMSVVGFWEVAKKFNYFINLLKNVEKIFDKSKFDAVILVDYPGFNLKLAKIAKKFNLKVIYYIAPQLWAWGKKRAENLRDNIDLLLSVLPFEVDFFKEFNINTKFVGHPLLDEQIFQEKFNGFDERENFLALMPGSRQQELKKHLPVFEKISKEFLKNNPEFRIAISLPKNLGTVNLNNYFEDFKFFEDAREMMKISKIGLIKTGTSTLEATFLGLPFVMIYKTSFLTYLFGRNLINLPYLSLPNILSNKFLVLEFIQNFDYSEVSSKLSEIISNRERYEQMQQEFAAIKRELGSSGASENAANEILNFIL